MWWLWIVIGIPVGALVIAGLMQAMHEINPDPGWRVREAEIRRLEQEQRLRELRGEQAP